MHRFAAWQWREPGSRLSPVRLNAGGHVGVYVEQTIVLGVGDGHHLRIGKDHIVYAGMVSGDVFSVIQKKWEFFYRGYSWNLFFPKGRNELRIDGVNLIVEDVSPDRLVLRA